MSTKQIMIACKQCAKPTLHLVDKPNHVLHLLLSVLTAGFWVLVWILVAITRPKPQCTVCGTRNSPHQSLKLTT